MRTIILISTLAACSPEPPQEFRSWQTTYDICQPDDPFRPSFEELPELSVECEDRLVGDLKLDDTVTGDLRARVLEATRHLLAREIPEDLDGEYVHQSLIDLVDPDDPRASLYEFVVNSFTLTTMNPDCAGLVLMEFYPENGALGLCPT